MQIIRKSKFAIYLVILWWLISISIMLEALTLRGQGEYPHYLFCVIWFFGMCIVTIQLLAFFDDISNKGG